MSVPNNQGERGSNNTTGHKRREESWGLTWQVTLTYSFLGSRLWREVKGYFCDLQIGKGFSNKTPNHKP